MLLAPKKIYKLIPAILADPRAIRANWHPTLAVSGGNIRLHAGLAISQMQVDTESLAPGIYTIVGEFQMLAYEVVSGEPVVRTSNSLSLEPFGDLS